MEKKQNRVVEFIKNHKEDLAVAAVSVITLGCGIAFIAMGKKKPEAPDSWFAGTIHTPACKDIKVDGWGLGTLSECWHENGGINVIVGDLTVADAGKLGEELLKIEGVTSDSDLCAIIGLSKGMVEL